MSLDHLNYTTDTVLSDIHSRKRGINFMITKSTIWLARFGQESSRGIGEKSFIEFSEFEYFRCNIELPMNSLSENTQN